MTQLHFAVVHFPVALFVTGLAFDFACLALPKQTWLDRSALVLHVLGALSAGAAVLTGKLAAGSLAPLSDGAQAAVAEHSDLAFFTLVALFLVAALRFETFWRDRNRSELRLHRLRVAAVAAGLGALVLLFQTASRGADLVFRFGLGISRELLPGPL